MRKLYNRITIRQLAAILGTLLIIAALTIPSNFFHTGPQKVYAVGDAWWDGNWPYRAKVDCLAQLTRIHIYYDDALATDNGEIDCSANCQTDFDDIRVVDHDAVEITTWEIVNEVDSDVMEILVTSTDSYIYVYWGNGAVAGLDWDAWGLKAALPMGQGVWPNGPCAGSYSSVNDKTYVAFQTVDYGAAIMYYDHATGESSGYYNDVAAPTLEDYHNVPTAYASHTGLIHFMPGVHSQDLAYYRSADEEIYEDQRYVVNDDASSSIYGTGVSRRFVYQVFVPAVTHDMKWTVWKVNKTGSPTGNAVLSVYAADSGTHLPTGSSLASGTLDASTVSASVAWMSVSLGAGCTVTAGTHYCLIWSPPDTDWASGSKCLNFRTDASSPTYAHGVAYCSTGFLKTINSYTTGDDDVGDAWYTDATHEMQSGLTFTPASTHYMAFAKFYLYKQNDPTGTCYLRLYAADGSHKPTGAVLSEASIDISTLTTTKTWKTLYFGTPYQVQSGTEYCLVWYYGAGSSDHRLFWRIDTVASGGYYLNRGMGGGWNYWTTYKGLYEEGSNDEGEFEDCAWTYATTTVYMFREGTGAFVLKSSQLDTSVSYPMMFEANDARLFVFYRDITSSKFGWCYLYSDDDGTTWTGPTRFLQSIDATTNDCPYALSIMVEDNYDIHVVWTWYDYGNKYDDVYYMKYDYSEGKWLSAAGTDISDHIPLTESNSTTHAEVRVRDTTQTDVNTNILPVITLAGDGSPCIAWKEDGAGTDIAHKFTKWDGDDWTTNLVTIRTNTDATSYVQTGHFLEYNAGGDCGAGYYYYFKYVQGSTYEIQRWYSSDGASWAKAVGTYGGDLTIDSTYPPATMGYIANYDSELQVVVSHPDNLGGLPDTLSGWPTDFGMTDPTIVHSSILIYEDKFDRDKISQDYDSPYTIGLYYPDTGSTLSTKASISSYTLLFGTRAAHTYAHFSTGRAWTFDNTETTIELKYKALKSGKTAVAQVSGLIKFANGWSDEAHLKPNDGIVIKTLQDDNVTCSVWVGGVETVLNIDDEPDAGNGYYILTYHWHVGAADDGAITLDWSADGSSIDNNICAGDTVPNLVESLNVFYGMTHDPTCTETMAIDDVNFGFHAETGGEVTYETPVISISNVSDTEAMGFVAASATTWALGTTPNWPLTDDNCTFTVTNIGNIAIDIGVHAHDWTGGVGWTLAGAVGEDTVKMTAYKEGDGSGDGKVLTTVNQAFISNLLMDDNVSWEYKLETGTFTDAVEKSTTIRLTAVQH